MKQLWLHTLYQGEKKMTFLTIKFYFLTTYVNLTGFYINDIIHLIKSCDHLVKLFFVSSEAYGTSHLNLSLI